MEFSLIHNMDIVVHLDFDHVNTLLHSIPKLWVFNMVATKRHAIV